MKIAKPSPACIEALDGLGPVMFVRFTKEESERVKLKLAFDISELLLNAELTRKGEGGEDFVVGILPDGTGMAACDEVARKIAFLALQQGIDDVTHFEMDLDDFSALARDLYGAESDMCIHLNTKDAPTALV